MQLAHFLTGNLRGRSLVMAHSSPPRKRSRGGGGSSRETTSTAIAIEDDRDESRERALSLELESSSDDDGEEEDEDEEEEEGEEEKEGPRRENAEERKRNGAGSSGGRNGESKSIGAGASATSTNDVLKTVARHTTSVLQKAWAVEKACDVALRLKRHNTRLRVRHAGVRRQRMQLVLRVITEAAKPLPVGALKAGAAPDSAPRFEQHILLSAEKAEGASSPDPEVNDAQETTVDVTDAVKTIVVRYMVRFSRYFPGRPKNIAPRACSFAECCPWCVLSSNSYVLGRASAFCVVWITCWPVTGYGLAAARSQNTHQRQSLAGDSCTRAACPAGPPSRCKLRFQRWSRSEFRRSDKSCLSSRYLQRA